MLLSKKLGIASLPSDAVTRQAIRGPGGLILRAPSAVTTTPSESSTTSLQIL